MSAEEAHLEIAATLASMPGSVAVVLGGSRALGTATDGSDWDLGVYYRGSLDLSALRAVGNVYPPGSWGRVMNGGAWLSVGEVRVDVLLRDLDVVEHWSARAYEGTFEIDALLGYLAGVPTYSLLAERAVAIVLHGELPAVPSFPRALAERAPARWRFNSQFSLDYAAKHAQRGNAIGVVGQATKAIMEEAHARLCERARWVLNEKQLVELAGLTALEAQFATLPVTAEGQVRWLDELREKLCTR